MFPSSSCKLLLKKRGYLLRLWQTNQAMARAILGYHGPPQLQCLEENDIVHAYQNWTIPVQPIIKKWQGTHSFPTILEHI